MTESVSPMRNIPPCSPRPRESLRQMSIHPTAFVDAGAELGAEVTIGPYCIVGPNVRLHDGVTLHSNVVLQGNTEIGARTIVHPFSVLGGPPQHLGYKGEDTKLIVGAGNLIREHVTMNIGTEAGGGVTRIGSHGFFMVGAHVGHDCQVGDRVIFANNATLGGHVKIGDYVFLGGLCAIHQNCRIGDFAFIGGCAAVPSDVIPYASAMGNHARLAGLNIIGMKRRGLPRKTMHNLRNAYKLLFAEDDTFKDRLLRVRDLYGECEEVMRIVNFIEYDSSRSLMTPGR